MGDGNALYQSFLSATQEPVRLDLAVRCYFGGGVSVEASRELEAYLKRRVRPLMDLLMRLFCQQEPIQLPLLAPLTLLCEILSHEQQLLTFMS